MWTSYVYDVAKNYLPLNLQIADSLKNRLSGNTAVARHIFIIQNWYDYMHFAVGHTKIPLFFPNMDISIAIREDVRKNASVKKSGSFVKYSRCNSTFKF